MSSSTFSGLPSFSSLANLTGASGFSGLPTSIPSIINITGEGGLDGYPTSIPTIPNFANITGEGGLTGYPTTNTSANGDGGTIMSQFIVGEDSSLLTGITYTMIALSALTMILSVVFPWFSKNRQYCWTYATILLAATFSLIGRAIVAGAFLQDSNILSSITSAVTEAMGTFFFVIVFPVMVWIVAFVILIELGKNENEVSWKRYFTLKLIPAHLGFVLSIIWIICAIGVAGTFDSMVGSTGSISARISAVNNILTALQTIEAIAFGLWGMVFFAGCHLILFHDRLHFKKFQWTFYVFLFLLLLMTIGFTVLFGTFVSGSSADSIRGAEIVEFIFLGILAMLNLILVIFFRHYWVHEPEVSEVTEEKV